MGKNMPDSSAITVDAITVQYGRRTVLDGVSVSVAPGEIRVILGTSGCGKTTLLKAMIGLLQPVRGRVTIFGNRITEIDAPITVDTLKHVGVLFQNGALLGSLTVGENVALPLQMHTHLSKNMVRELVQFKLSQVDLPNAYSLYPQELSGGMRKRAALARALVLDPPIVFCDEPSAGLDPVTSAGLDNLLLRLRANLHITIVVVTHELASIQTIADRVLFLQNGKALFDGALTAALEVSEGPVYDFFNRLERTVPAENKPADFFNVENIV